MNESYSYNKKSLALLVMLLFVAVLIYFLPLQSPFIFDDFYNLSGLSDVEERGYLYFLLNSGFSGPTGRPVSLVTFALQHNAWPQDPFQFKLVNLIIHLANGVLVWVIINHILKILNRNSYQRLLITSATTAIWLLHPIQLTSVLYTVQRMTLLSCLFSLVAVAGYLYARQLTIRHESIRNYLLLTLAVIVPATLGILAKENAVLVLLLIAVIEITLFADIERPRYWKQWASIVIGLPLIILIAYMASQFSSTVSSYHFRDFSMMERLLTQPVVLLAYLKDIVIPTYGSFTLYHDGFPVSKDWLQPWYTLPCSLFLLLLIASAVFYRKRYRLFSFAILWFITAQLLESTYLNLELYFEHRNYLPSISICFGVASLLVSASFRIKQGKLGLLVPLGYITVIATVLFLEASLWHKPLLQANEWARHHPESIRSRNYLGNLYMSMGDFNNARQVFAEIDSIKPDLLFPVLQIQRIYSCRAQEGQNAVDWQATIQRAKLARPISLEITALLDVLLLEALKKQCVPGTLKNLEQLLKALVENRNFVFIRSYIYEFLAIISMSQQRFVNAYKHIENSILADTRVETQVLRLRILNLLEREDLIRETLDKLERNAGKNPKKRLALEQIRENYNNQ